MALRILHVCHRYPFSQFHLHTPFTIQLDPYQYEESRLLPSLCRNSCECERATTFMCIDEYRYNFSLIRQNGMLSSRKHDLRCPPL